MREPISHSFNATMAVIKFMIAKCSKCFRFRPTFLLRRRIMILLNHSDCSCMSSQHELLSLPERRQPVLIAQASHRGVACSLTRTCVRSSLAAVPVVDAVGTRQVLVMCELVWCSVPVQCFVRDPRRSCPPSLVVAMSVCQHLSTAINRSGLTYRAQTHYGIVLGSTFQAMFASS